MKRTRIAFLLTLTLGVTAATPSLAQPPKPTRSQLRSPAWLERHEQPKASIEAALFLSLGATLGGVAAGAALLATGSEGSEVTGATLLGASVILGPSVGHYYVGETSRGTIHALIRSALVAGGTLFVMAALVRRLETGEDDSTDHGIPTMLTGGLCMFGAAAIHGIYGIVDGARAVKRANAKRYALSVSPQVTKTVEGATRYGVALVGRF